MILVAGQAASYQSNGTWTSLDGDVKITGTGNITVGTGGVAAIYSGSIDKTTGTSSMVPSGSGKFRYNSDESTTNYTKALKVKGGTDTGVNIIYREAPEIQVTANSTAAGTLTYNGSIQNDPNAGVTSNINATGVLKNNDVTSLTGTANITYAKGTETDLKNAGTYTVKASNLTNELGYKINYVDGSLVIDKATLTKVTGGKTYDGQTLSVTAGTNGGNLTFEGVGGEKAALASTKTIAISSANAGDQSVTADAVKALTSDQLTAVSGSTLIDLSNYNLVNGTISGDNKVTVNKATLTKVTGGKTYDGQNTLTVGSNGGVLNFFGVNNENASISAGSVALSGKDVVTNGQTVTSITTSGLALASGATLDLNNYNLSTIPVAGINNANNKVTIDKAKLTEVSATKVHDGNAYISGDALTIKGVNGEEFSTATQAIAASRDIGVDSNNVTNVSALNLTGKTAAALASNYDQTKAPVLNKVTITAATPAVVVRTPTVTVTKSSTSRVAASASAGFQLASAEEPEQDELCSAGNTENCVCVESSVSSNISICVSSGGTTNK